MQLLQILPTFKYIRLIGFVNEIEVVLLQNKEQNIKNIC